MLVIAVRIPLLASRFYIIHLFYGLRIAVVHRCVSPGTDVTSFEHRQLACFVHFLFRLPCPRPLPRVLSSSSSVTIVSCPRLPPSFSSIVLVIICHRPSFSSPSSFTLISWPFNHVTLVIHRHPCFSSLCSSVTLLSSCSHLSPSSSSFVNLVPPFRLPP